MNNSSAAHVFFLLLFKGRVHALCVCVCACMCVCVCAQHVRVKLRLTAALASGLLRRPALDPIVEVLPELGQSHCNHGMGSTLAGLLWRWDPCMWFCLIHGGCLNICLEPTQHWPGSMLMSSAVARMTKTGPGVLES